MREIVKFFAARSEVVTRDLETYTIVAGVPAKPLTRRAASFSRHCMPTAKDAGDVAGVVSAPAYSNAPISAAAP